ncbi:MAG: hypothetical protein ABS79_06830 [Planctomycetes bacterium SCN 63-9]|nr:MAG: hypothetical protein ABS79_06830 [Planctomycetes bacterium SCN 63-9]
MIVGGFVPIPYPIFVLGPPVLSAKGPPALYDPGPRIAVPPPDAERDAQAAGIDAAREGRVPDTNRASQLVTIGDRLFRANNFKKAGERYLQAARLDPYAAEPRIRLIQLAFVRGQYAEAAHQLRQVSTVQPGWLRIPFDIQSIYGEPVDFSRYIARLESHLHAHPQDRDAWLVLGAQWFLTGRKSKAADIFLRLDDPRQRPDVALAAFINNSGTQAPD